MNINYEAIHDTGDPRLVIPEGFRRDPDTGELPKGTTYIGYGHVSEGQRLEDAAGNRFRLLAHGPMQGTAVLRDRNQRMFYVDTDLILRPVR
jgi:hypothetical protein